MDWLLLIVTIMLAIISLLTIYSVTSGNQGRTDMVFKQLTWFLLGFAMMILMISIDYRTLSAFTYPFYLFILTALVVVLMIGPVISGSQRWIRLGSFSFQPSEFAKLASIFVLARYFSNKKRDTASFVDLLVTGILIGILFALVLVQPDLGTAMLLVFIFIFVIFTMGLKWKYFVIASLVGICVTPFIWIHLKEYQKNRLVSFLNPDKDPLGSGYNVIQSKIAIGSGGFWGKGYMQGTQSQLNFIPEQFTDFIFSVIGEEWGFLGTVTILLLYFTIIYRGLYIALNAKDKLGMLIAVGIVSVFIMHVVVNIGMCVGIMPVTGIPLPLISYGGTSVLSNLVGIGLLLNIQIRRFMF